MKQVVLVAAVLIAALLLALAVWALTSQEEATAPGPGATTEQHVLIRAPG
jgi:lysylphosphatidylglycerol synthetase-like protein (DUF2156 family)